jgi:aminoglycoside/choline kinase family phosphotransferase
MTQTRFVAGKDFGSVILNGVEIPDVFECDTKHGFVLCYSRDEDGKLEVDGDEVHSKMLIGQVVFLPLLQR